ncbi:MAG: thioredoxin family protein [Bacteroidota bacterium]|nr:thioredoxin family protein [Bacteroidota bacterium]
MLLFIPAIITAAPPEIGKPAPDFSLHDVDGKIVKLSDFKGKIVVLEWINEGCPFVKGHYENGHIPSMQQFYTQMGVIWLTINSTRPDNPEAHNAAQSKEILAKWHAHSTANLMDEDRTVGHLYDAKTTPHMYVIDKEGNLRYQGAIDDDRSTDGGKKASTNYVLQALDALIAGKDIVTTSTRPYGCSVKY